MDHRVTYCRICEPMCGLIAAVENDRSSRPEDLEQLAGMAVLNGVAVRIEVVP